MHNLPTTSVLTNSSCLSLSNMWRKTTTIDNVYARASFMFCSLNAKNDLLEGQALQN